MRKPRMYSSLHGPPDGAHHWVTVAKPGRGYVHLRLAGREGHETARDRAKNWAALHENRIAAGLRRAELAARGPGPRPDRPDELKLKKTVGRTAEGHRVVRFAIGSAHADVEVRKHGYFVARSGEDEVFDRDKEAMLVHVKAHLKSEAHAVQLGRRRK